MRRDLDAARLGDRLHHRDLTGADNLRRRRNLAGHIHPNAHEIPQRDFDVRRTVFAFQNVLAVFLANEVRNVFQRMSARGDLVGVVEHQPSIRPDGDLLIKVRRQRRMQLHDVAGL